MGCCERMNILRPQITLSEGDTATANILVWRRQPEPCEDLSMIERRDPVRSLTKVTAFPLLETRHEGVPRRRTGRLSRRG